MKDPLLEEYSLEELLYEYYEFKEWHKYQRENVEQSSDKIEETRLKESLDWAEEQERLEMEELEKKKASKQEPDDFEPSEEDKKWMEEQLKAQLGDLPDTMSVNFSDEEEVDGE